MKSIVITVATLGALYGVVFHTPAGTHLLESAAHDTSLSEETQHVAAGLEIDYGTGFLQSGDVACERDATGAKPGCVSFAGQPLSGLYTYVVGTNAATGDTTLTGTDTNGHTSVFDLTTGQQSVSGSQAALVNAFNLDN